MSEKNTVENCCEQWSDKVSSCCASNAKSVPACCDNSNNQAKEEK